LEITEQLYFTNRKDWRLWLEKNYDKKKEIWLVYYKKHTGIPSIPYDGLEKYEYGMKNNLLAPATDENTKVPKDFQIALEAEKKALENFSNLAPSYRIMYIYWIINAKKEETRKRRIEKAVKLLKENKKPWEMN